LKVSAQSPRGTFADSWKGAQARFTRGSAFERGDGQPKDLAEAGYWYALTRESAETSTETCFSKVLFNDGSDVLSKEEIGGLTSALIGGGVDTTTSTMLSFILACIAFPVRR